MKKQAKPKRMKAVTEWAVVDENGKATAFSRTKSWAKTLRRKGERIAKVRVEEVE